MSRWWRAYDEAVDDPKLLLLSDRTHRAWFNLMCLASIGGGRLPERKVIELKLRLSASKVQAIMDELTQAGLIEDDGNGFVPHNWNGRQYKSDVSTERVKRFRKRERNVSVTPPDTDTDTESKKDIRAVADATRPPKPRGTRLPDDWEPSSDDRAFAASKGFRLFEIEIEATKFRNYWTAKAGKDATKLDWSRTWQNWILNAKPTVTHGHTSPRNGLAAALQQLGRSIEDDRCESGSPPPPRLLSSG